MRDRRPYNYNFRLNRYSSHASVHVHLQQCSIYLLQLGLHHRQFSLSVIFQVCKLISKLHPLVYRSSDFYCVHPSFFSLSLMLRQQKVQLRMFFFFI